MQHYILKRNQKKYLKKEEYTVTFIRSVAKVDANQDFILRVPGLSDSPIASRRRLWLCDERLVMDFWRRGPYGDCSPPEPESCSSVYTEAELVRSGFSMSKGFSTPTRHIYFYDSGCNWKRASGRSMQPMNVL